MEIKVAKPFAGLSEGTKLSARNVDALRYTTSSGALAETKVLKTKQYGVISYAFLKAHGYITDDTTDTNCGETSSCCTNQCQAGDEQESREEAQKEIWSIVTNFLSKFLGGIESDRLASKEVVLRVFGNKISDEQPTPRQVNRPTITYAGPESIKMEQLKNGIAIVFNNGTKKMFATKMRAGQTFPSTTILDAKRENFKPFTLTKVSLESLKKGDVVYATSNSQPRFTTLSSYYKVLSDEEVPGYDRLAYAKYGNTFYTSTDAHADYYKVTLVEEEENEGCCIDEDEDYYF